MRLQTFADAATFLKKTEAYLFHDEAANNLILSATSALVQNPLFGAPIFATYPESGAIEATAVWIPGHKALLSDGPADAGKDFARLIATRTPLIPQALKGVLAPPSTGQAFVQECQHLLHAQAHLGLEQVIMRLDLRAPLTPQTRKAPGRLRRAWMEDFNVLRGWAQAMVLELKLYEAPHETAEVIRRAVEGRRYFVWDNGGPVAMFGHSGHTPHGARINSVYVPPAHRGRGYATAGVWQLSELLRQSGKSFACLFADRHNPQTIRMYEKLGYKIIGALDETRFVHGE